MARPAQPWIMSSVRYLCFEPTLKARVSPVYVFVVGHKIDVQVGYDGLARSTE